MLSVSKVAAIEEIEQVKKLMEKWSKSVTEGIPGLDYSVLDESEVDLFIRQWVGELRLCAGKLDNLADILAGVR